jgi:hypothetical protein
MSKPPALIIEAVSTSETSVNLYQTTRRNNPEDRHLHTLLTHFLSCDTVLAGVWYVFYASFRVCMSFYHLTLNVVCSYVDWFSFLLIFLCSSVVKLIACIGLYFICMCVCVCVTFWVRNRTLLLKPLKKHPPGKPRRRWKDSIKMHDREIGCQDGTLMELAQDRVQLRALVFSGVALSGSPNTELVS